VKTIAEAIARIDRDKKPKVGPNLSDEDRRNIYEETKRSGKIVAFEGTPDNPSMLINLGGRTHISIQISRVEASVLVRHFTDILLRGAE